MLKIAVDFDGTIVEDAYPDIGKPMLFAFETLRELQKQKHQIILWTYRSGAELEAAVEFCRENGVEFYAVNNSYPEEIFIPDFSRKIHAHVFIDDRNIGGFPGWSKVWQMLDNGGNAEASQAFDLKTNDKPGIWQKILGRKQ
jgi:hypothetical protein